MSSPLPTDNAVAPLAAPQHEFTAQQDAVIGKLAGDMKWVAAPMLAIGVIYMLVFVQHAVRAFRGLESVMPTLFIGLAMVFFLAFGIWTSRASDAFRRITRTNGSDISNLMEGLGNLGSVYSVMSLFVKFYVVLILAAFVAAFAAAVR